MVDQGLEAARAGHLREAEKAYLKAIRIDPKNTWAHNNLGVVYDRMKLYQKALWYYQKAVQLDPRNKTARKNLENERRWLRKQKESQAFDRAYDLAKNNRNQEAEWAYRKYLQMNPNSRVAWNNLGNVLANLGRLKEAEQAYLRSLSIDRNYHYARENLGRLRNRIKENREYSAYQRGSAPYFKGNYADAVIHLRAFLRSHPDSSRAQSACEYLGDALIRLGRLDEAEIVYRKGYGLAQKKSGGKVVFENLAFRLANEYERKKKFNNAELIYKEIIQNNPRSDRAWSELGDLLERHKRTQKAEEAYQKALRINPRAKNAKRGLERIRDERTVARARSFSNRKQYKRAEKEYRDILQKHPKQSWVWNNLGNALWNQGRREEAQKAYQKALSLNPTNKTAKKNLKMARNYNESVLRVLDPVGAAFKKAARSRPGRLVQNYGARTYQVGKDMASAVRDRTVTLWNQARQRLGWAAEEPRGNSLAARLKPIIDMSAFGSITSLSQKEDRKKETIEWFKEQSADKIAEKIPGAQVVKSIGDRYKRIKKEFDEATRKSIFDLFATMDEGVAKLGSASVDDEIVDRAWKRFEKSGSRWKTAAKKISGEDISARLKGKDFLGLGGSTRSEKRRIIPLLGVGDHPDNARWNYHKWFGKSE